MKYGGHAEAAIAIGRARWLGVLRVTLAVAIGSAIATFSQAQVPVLIVVNNDPNGDAIHSVYVWHADAESQGPNRLGTVLFDRDPPWLFVGESVEIMLQGGGMRDRCQFKILIEDTDGDWVEYDADLCEVDHVVFP